MMLSSVSYSAFVRPQDGSMTDTLPLLRSGGGEHDLPHSESESELVSDIPKADRTDKSGSNIPLVPSLAGPSSPTRSISRSPPSKSSRFPSPPPTPLPSLGPVTPTAALIAFQDASRSVYQPLPALISRLVRHFVLNPPQANTFPEEPSFVDSFLLCYRRFCTPRDVCLGLTLKLREVDKLAEEQDASSFGVSYKHYVRLRIASLLLYWIGMYPNDFIHQSAFSALRALRNIILESPQLFHYMEELKVFTDRMGAVGALEDDIESSWAAPPREDPESDEDEPVEPDIDASEHGVIRSGPEFTQSKRMSFLKAARFDSSTSLSLSLGSWTAPRKLSAPAAPTNKTLPMPPQVPRKMSSPIPSSSTSPTMYSAASTSSSRGHGAINGRSTYTETQLLRQLGDIYSKLSLIPFADFAKEISRKQTKLFLNIEPRDWLRHFLDRPPPPVPPKNEKAAGGDESDTETISDETIQNSNTSLDSVATTVFSSTAGSLGRAGGVGALASIASITTPSTTHLLSPKSRPEKHRRDPITDFSEYFNRLSSWITSVIIASESPTKRVRVICYFVNVAQQLRILHNYSGLRAMTAGILNSTFDGDPTFALFSSQHEDLSRMLNRYEILMQSTNNHAKYRTAMLELAVSAIPDIEIHSSDIIRLNSIQPDCHRTDSSMINWGKFSKMSQIINLLKKYQHRCRRGLTPQKKHMEIADWIVKGGLTQEAIESRLAAPDYLKLPPGKKSPDEETSSSSNLIKLTKNMLQLS